MAAKEVPKAILARGEEPGKRKMGAQKKVSGGVMNCILISLGEGLGRVASVQPKLFKAFAGGVVGKHARN